MSRWIAIDYGLKRVGIAVTDPLRIIASALTTIENAKILSFLTDYCLKEQVSLILIGYPLQLDGNESLMSREVDKFVLSLQKQFPHIPVKKIDERFTSKEAMYTLVQSGIKKKDRRDKTLLDQVSAALLLQSYMQNPNQ